MRLVLISLASLVLAVCNAAPLRWELPIEARESSDLFEVRDDVFEDLFARAPPPEPYPGPGLKHKLESTPPITGFTPIPQGTYFKTPTKVYSANDVNQAAIRMFTNLGSAGKYTSKASGSLKSYPKPSTGFRPHETDNPAPNDGTNVAYHAPIGGPRQYTIGPKGSAKVGADRVVAYRKTADAAHTIGVSFHDPSKPIPVPKKGQVPSNNHPFSMAQPLHGGALKVATEKFKMAAKNAAKTATKKVSKLVHKKT